MPFRARKIIYLLIALISTLTGGVWAYLHWQWLPILLLTAGLTAWLSYTIIRWQTTLYNKINFFFAAVDNNDFSIRYAEEGKLNMWDKTLHQHLNKLSESIQKNRLALQQQEQYYSLLLDHVAIGVLTVNKKGEIVQINQATKDLLHYPHLSHIKQLKKISLQLYQAIKHAHSNPTQLVQIPKADQAMQLVVKATSLRTWTKEELTLISLQDIRKELDDKELDSWVKLIRVLIHEIMNTIAPITSLAESLTQYEGSPAAHNKDLCQLPQADMHNISEGIRIIHDRSRGLMSFVESCRKITRIPKPLPTLFNIKNTLDTIKILLSGEENYQSTTLSFHIQTADLHVYADSNHFHLIMLNLLKNALAAVQGMGSKAHIRVEAQNDHLHNCQIRVIDNGPGITPEVMENIFVPFFTTKAQGTGIGLNISRQMMQQHGGSLKVFSQAGKTVFTAEFPPQSNTQNA